jgi:sulfur carrier protein
VGRAVLARTVGANVIVAVNGEPVELGSGATVETVLASLDVGAQGVAVALNGEVVPKSRWHRTRLRADDRVEVLTAVQGG